jgi:TRAP-type C4-dicarboxylate transport system permease small subunit
MWAGIQLIDRTWFQQSPLLQVPKWTVYLAIPVGAGFEALLMLLTWGRDDGYDDDAAAEPSALPSPDRML